MNSESLEVNHFQSEQINAKKTCHPFEHKKRRRKETEKIETLSYRWKRILELITFFWLHMEYFASILVAKWSYTSTHNSNESRQKNGIECPNAEKAFEDEDTQMKAMHLVYAQANAISYRNTIVWLLFVVQHFHETWMKMATTTKRTNEIVVLWKM